MQYSSQDLSKLKSSVISKMMRMFDDAVESNTLDEFLLSFNIELDEIISENPAFYSYTRKTKILVFGALKGKRNDYIRCAKECGIDKDNLEFADYTETKKFDTTKLEYSDQYSDIIYGPTPHKIKGTADNSSFLVTLKNNPDKYPKLYNAIDGLSITQFKLALIKSRYKERFCEL